MAIKNHMVARQQTNLQEFLWVQDDLVFIFDHKGKILFFNQAAKELFSLLGEEEINLERPSFAFK
jgi:PAS domain-containing protein